MSPPPIPFGQAVRVWARIGLASFGGPAGQIAVMHRILVEEQRWLGEERFLHALNYCMLLPGPEATQLATYVGWLMHRTRGGIVAGTLFVLPGIVAMLVLSAIYAVYSSVGIVEGIFSGLKPAVLAVVIEAVVRIGRRALRTPALACIALGAFVAIFFFGVAFPWIVVGGGVIGAVGARLWPGQFPGGTAHAPKAAEGAAAPAPQDEPVLDAMLKDGPLPHMRPSLARAAVVLVVCLILWFAPIAAVASILGTDHVITEEAIFFSKTAVVTFGGAYAVLAYVAQHAVTTHHWLGPGAMLDGLGLAETTPGPLIMVVQFVGFLGAYHHPGDLPPFVAGVLGALLSTWVTFVPCFLWIFLGAPWVEALRANRLLASALAAITGAVVGVILNLSIWFAMHVVFARVHPFAAGPFRMELPDVTSVRPLPLVIAVAALIAMLRFEVPMGWTLLAAAVVGAVAHFLQ